MNRSNSEIRKAAKDIFKRNAGILLLCLIFIQFIYSSLAIAIVFYILRPMIMGFPIHGSLFVLGMNIESVIYGIITALLIFLFFYVFAATQLGMQRVYIKSVLGRESKLKDTVIPILDHIHVWHYLVYLFIKLFIAICVIGPKFFYMYKFGTDSIKFIVVATASNIFIYVIDMYFALAPVIIAGFRDMKTLDAIKKSLFLMNGKKMKLFSIIIHYLIIMMIISYILGIFVHGALYYVLYMGMLVYFNILMNIVYIIFYIMAVGKKPEKIY